MRTADPAYLDHVGRWWATLFAKLRRYLHNTILMVQVGEQPTQVSAPTATTRSFFHAMPSSTMCPAD